MLGKECFRQGEGQVSKPRAGNLIEMTEESQGGWCRW